MTFFGDTSDEYTTETDTDTKMGLFSQIKKAVSPSILFPLK